MANPIHFYFDFASPYGYMGATKISALAAKYGRGVEWKPYLLGAVFKITGGVPLPAIPLKGDYHRRDMERCARLHGIPFKLPTKFPIAGQSPARVVYWLEPQGPAKQEEAVLALYRAYMVNDRDISSPDVTADVVAALGHDRQKALDIIGDPAMKERLKQETEAAIQLGAFGSPHVIVDAEPFWGFDRFDQIDRWLGTGGW